MAGEMRALANTDLGKAIFSGDIQKVKNLVKNKETVTFKDWKGNTYLHYISTIHRPYILHIVAEAGIDLNAQNRHGNTALHVTALQNDCCHVGDLMALGIDPLVKNNDGLKACEIKTTNKYWHTIYNRYTPGLFEAVRLHDNQLILHLLHSWCKVYAYRDKQTVRQYAASLKYHDVVFMLDQHRHTLEMIYGVFEYDIEKTKHALPSDKCDINFRNEASQIEYIIQHAIRQGHVAMVALLCQFGAGLDINLSVQINQYIRGPLYFETLNEKVNPLITRLILSSSPNLALKDERGRSPVIYAMDKLNGKVPIDILSFMLDNGTPFTARDVTGLTARDIARFAQRSDLVELIDKKFIKLVRQSNLDGLKEIVMDAYDSIMINYNYRDTYVYAMGNESTQTWEFLDGLQHFHEVLTSLHTAIAMGEVYTMKRIFEDSAIDWNMSLTPTEQTYMLLNTKDKGGRTAFTLAVLHERIHCIKFLLQDQYRQMINFDREDNCSRTVYHYACAIPDKSYRCIVKSLNIDSSVRDVNQLRAKDYKHNKDMHAWFKREKKKCYGLTTELTAVEKYEELRKIITSKSSNKQDFKNATRNFKLPLSTFYALLSHLMPGYRDLLFLAIDYGKDDIAARLADIGCDCTRKETYNYVPWTKDKRKQFIEYDAPARAEELGKPHLAKYLLKKQVHQLKKKKSANLKVPIKSHYDKVVYDKIVVL